MSFLIDEMQPDDWDEVRQIYQEGIETGMATFETKAPDWQTWSAGKRPDCRLVARAGSGRVVGWAVLSPTSKRAVYAGVCEVTVYVAADMRGRGIGRMLMRALVEASEEVGVWMLQSAIFPENKASIALHERFGFRILGRRERVAKLHGVWRDTVLMERRSGVVGVD